MVYSSIIKERGDPSTFWQQVIIFPIAIVCGVYFTIKFIFTFTLKPFTDRITVSIAKKYDEKEIKTIGDLLINTYTTKGYLCSLCEVGEESVSKCRKGRYVNYTNSGCRNFTLRSCYHTMLQDVQLIDK